MMNVPSLFASFIICMLFLQVKDEQQIWGSKLTEDIV
jgi:hypothetical protein